MIMFGVPLLLVALGGMCAERGGIVNIALEGIMIIGGLCSCLFLSMADKAGWGQTAPQLTMLAAILIAGASGVLYSLLLAFASINLKADQVIGGTALNTFAPAFAIILSWAVQGQGQTTIYIPSWIRIGRIVTDTDGFFYRVLFKNFYLTTIIAVILFIRVVIVLYKTRFGLRLRSCGEHPSAADSVGINVYRMRYAGTMISGFLAGIGGLAFTVAAGSGFVATVAGYGFLALAVMIFGNWKPLNILFAALFFSLFKVVGSYASSISFLPHFENVKNSQYIYQMLPYVVTMIVLIFTSKKSRAPKAEGIPYDKGQR
jgi:simple sugar transport system permease protein